MAGAITIPIIVAIEDSARMTEAPAAPPWADTMENLLLPQARVIATRHGMLSTSLLQHTLHIGYRRAERLLAQTRGNWPTRPPTGGEPE